MAKAYLNALAEEGTRQDLIDWLVKLDAECDALKDAISDPGLQPCECIKKMNNGFYAQDCDCHNWGDLADAEGWCTRKNIQIRAGVSQ